MLQFRQMKTLQQFASVHGTFQDRVDRAKAEAEAEEADEEVDREAERLGVQSPSVDRPAP